MLSHHCALPGDQRAVSGGHRHATVHSCPNRPQRLSSRASGWNLNRLPVPHAGKDADAPPGSLQSTISGVLAEDALLELAPPSSSASGHLTVWQTRASAALPVRVEQLCRTDRCWLRIVAVERGVERNSAWTLWQDAVAPLLSHSTLPGHDVLLLDAGGGMVQLRIRRKRD